MVVNPTLSIRSGSKVKGRRSLLRDGESLCVRDDSPGSAKRLKGDAGEVVEAVSNLHSGLVPSSTLPASPKSGVTPLTSQRGGVNQSPRGTRGPVRPVAAREPDIKFDTFDEFMMSGNPVPKDVVLRAMEQLRDDFKGDVPASKVAILWDFVVVMDQPKSFLVHIRPEVLAKMQSGMDLTFRGRGPAHVFCMVELLWIKQTDLSGETKRAWTVVHFHRGKRMAILWDLCPGLDIRGRLGEWALQPEGAFSHYTMQYRSALAPGIPADEWWATGAAQLCHLRYWLEYFRQTDCMKELTREVHATPNGFVFSEAQRKKAKAGKKN